MIEMDFREKKSVLDNLKIIFPVNSAPVISEKMRGIDDAEMVFDFFSGKKWFDLANEINLGKDGYALDLGVGFLERKDFIYYVPLYIYASLLNQTECWVFETDFIQYYLCPEYQDDECFFEFIFYFNNEQLYFLSQFLEWEVVASELHLARRSLSDFWSMYVK